MVQEKASSAACKRMINGPFACGMYPYITIFRLCLKEKLRGGEMVEGDRGYRGEPMKIRLPFECLSESAKRAKDCA